MKLIGIADKEVLRSLRGWLDQPLLKSVNFAFLVIGCLFWVEAQLQNEAFDTATFGRFATSFKAEVWAMLMMVGSASCLLGLINPRHRWRTIIGGGVMMLNFGGLAYSALGTGGSLVVGLHAAILFFPLFVRVTWEAWNDWP